jgi:hypothetical protein
MKTEDQLIRRGVADTAGNVPFGIGIIQKYDSYSISRCGFGCPLAAPRAARILNPRRLLQLIVVRLTLLADAGHRFLHRGRPLALVGGRVRQIL